MLITVFTPTYNRAHTLIRVYESLKSQTFNDFEWLIIDDGSIDNTLAVVEGFKKSSDLNINYIKKENGGKHTAYNLALEHAKGVLFFVVDSDDWLTENSLEIIHEKFRQLKFNEEVAGIIALKVYSNHKIIGQPYKNDNIFKTLRELERSGQQGERSIVLKTSIAKLYKFPVVKGEKFITEGVIYDRMMKYKFWVLNSVLTICEYQADGLSSNPKHLMVNNPKGYKIYYSKRIDLAETLIERINYVLRYNVFKKFSKTDVDSPNYNGHHLFLVKILNLLTPLALLKYPNPKI